MDDTMSQSPQVPQPPQSPPELPATHVKLILTVAIVLSLAAAAYLCGTSACYNAFTGEMDNGTETKIAPTGSVTITDIAPTNATMPTDIEQSEQTEQQYTVQPLPGNTAGFAVINSTPYMSYRGKIYRQPDQFQAGEADLGSPDQFRWIPLVEAPAYVEERAGEPIYDELFSWKMFPDNKRILFVMRWSTGRDTVFNFYYYNPDADERVKLVMSSPEDFGDLEYSVPTLYTFDEFGMYIAIQMFGCWNCGGHKPETILVDTTNWKYKSIGKVSYFNWKKSSYGTYEYKDYIVKECPEPAPGECSEDPAGLPLKEGTVSL